MNTSLSKKVTFKLLTSADYDSYFALRLESLQQAPHMYATDANDWQNAPREVIEKHLTLSESGKSPIFSAWDGDSLIGQVGLQPDSRPTVQHKATIWGLYVAPNYRRQGIGTKLLADAIDSAQQKPNLRQLRAVVNTTNQAAVRLFQNAGFTEFGLERRAKFIDGRYHDQIYLWYPFDNEN